MLKRQGVTEIDLLSIDIRSDDLPVWRRVSTWSPTIVIVELNPVIPFDTRYVNPPGANHGNSALALKELGDEKGYILAEGLFRNLVSAAMSRRWRGSKRSACRGYAPDGLATMVLCP